MISLILLSNIVSIVVKPQKRNDVYFILLFLTTIQTIINNIFYNIHRALENYDYHIVKHCQYCR